MTDETTRSGLAGQSMRLMLLGRDSATSLGRSKNCTHCTSNIDICTCDLTKEEDINDVTAHIAAKYGRLDILVHCEGVVEHRGIADAPVATLDWQYAANVRGPPPK